MSELRELGHKLKPYWQKFDTKHPPESILLAPGYKVHIKIWPTLISPHYITGETRLVGGA